MIKILTKGDPIYIDPKSVKMMLIYGLERGGQLKIMFKDGSDFTFFSCEVLTSLEKLADTICENS